MDFHKGKILQSFVVDDTCWSNLEFMEKFVRRKKNKKEKRGTFQIRPEKDVLGFSFLSFEKKNF